MSQICWRRQILCISYCLQPPGRALSLSRSVMSLPEIQQCSDAWEGVVVVVVVVVVLCLWAPSWEEAQKGPKVCMSSDQKLIKALFCGLQSFQNNPIVFIQTMPNKFTMIIQEGSDLKHEKRANIEQMWSFCFILFLLWRGVHHSQRGCLQVKYWQKV